MMLPVACAYGSASASSRTRSLMPPPGSPTRNVPMLPCMISPGSSQSAPKLTKLTTTRSGPTTADRVPAVRPFWKVTT